MRYQFEQEVNAKYKEILKFPSDERTAETTAFNRRRDKFQSIIESNDEFYILHRCTNIAATWLSQLSISLISDLANNEEGYIPRHEQKAALAFFSRLSNDLWAIIELIELGFDLQARALARGYLEHLDVLICCIHDEALTAEFVAAVEPEDENRFWHKNVSKNKAKRRVADFISGILNLDGEPLVDLLREDADTAGSALIHPTMTAGLITAFGTKDGAYDSFPIFPTPVAESAGVFRSILTHLFWLWFAMGPLPRDAHGRWNGLFSDGSLMNHLPLVRFSLLYSEMFGFLLHNQLLVGAVEDH